MDDEDEKNRDLLCPRCNALAVLLHAMKHPLPFVKTMTDDDGDRIVECELGPLFICFVSNDDGGDVHLAISLFDEPERVFDIAEPTEYDHDRPWLRMLAAVRMELDAKFGPLRSLDAHLPRHVH